MNEQSTKTVLAMDTALGGIAVGVMTSDSKTALRTMETQRDQAALLVPMVKEAMAEAGAAFQDLDLVVSTIGPGSFTGLRIGLSTARTFATALSIPVAGVNTLDLIATHYDTTGPFEKPEEIPLLIVLETKRQDFYARYYDAAGNPLGDAFAANASFIMEMAPEAAFCVGGDCLVRFKEEAEGDYQLLDPVTLPDPAVLARLGIKQAQEQAVREMPKPLYLRGADVSQPKTPPRKLEGN